MLATSAHSTAAAAAVALLLATAPAQAQDSHGAIAFGDAVHGETVAYGFAWNYTAREEVKTAALGACEAGGGTNCAEVAWFQNGCGALALNLHGLAHGSSAMSQDQAERRALRSCEAAGGSGCAVVGSLCAEPGGEAGTYSGSESVVPDPQRAGDDGSGRREAAGGRPTEAALTREERIEVQRGLAALGFDAGPADGMFGPRTRAAISDWQEAKDLEPTGWLTRDQASALAASGGSSEEGQTAPAPSESRVIYFAEAGPKCAELEDSDLGNDSAACWLEIQSRPGCYSWHEYYRSGYAFADWTGDCYGDTAHGRGTMSLVQNDVATTATGSLTSGKAHGRWILRSANGSTFEGPFVDGKQHGHWVIRFADGGTNEGPIVDGKKNGYWVERYADGQTEEGAFVDGKKHGDWVVRFASGNIHEGPFVNGKKHGHWVERFANGTTAEGPFVDGKQRGHWVIRFADGGTNEGPIVDGKKNGYWLERYADGQTEEGAFVDGKKHGDWVVRFASGNTHEGPFVNGKKHGHWVERFADGAAFEGAYVDGKKHGHWVIRFANGITAEGPMVDGEEHGVWVFRNSAGDTERHSFVNGERVDR